MCPWPMYRLRCILFCRTSPYQRPKPTSIALPANRRFISAKFVEKKPHSTLQLLTNLPPCQRVTWECRLLLRHITWAQKPKADPAIRTLEETERSNRFLQIRGLHISAGSTPKKKYPTIALAVTLIFAQNAPSMVVRSPNTGAHKDHDVKLMKKAIANVKGEYLEVVSSIGNFQNSMTKDKDNFLKLIKDINDRHGR